MVKYSVPLNLRCNGTGAAFVSILASTDTDLHIRVKPKNMLQLRQKPADLMNSHPRLSIVTNANKVHHDGLDYTPAKWIKVPRQGSRERVRNFRLSANQ
jgi:hypothetical protein